jgi:hypothetical protein
MDALPVKIRIEKASGQYQVAGLERQLTVRQSAVLVG